MNFLTFIDYDDTIFPTSFLNQLSIDLTTCYSVIDIDIKNAILDLEKSAINILGKSLNKGTVFIVTNADNNWAESSLDKFMPILSQFIKDKSIRIVSAKSLYENSYPGLVNVITWKRNAMTDLFFSIYDDNDNNKEGEAKKKFYILSIGDSYVERTALIQLSNIYPIFIPKTVKLFEFPTCDELIDELDLLTASLDIIYEFEDKLNLELHIDDGSELATIKNIDKLQPTSQFKTKD
jgi:hypothetical protein